MRIVHVDAERGFSGGEVQVFLLLEGLLALGHECVLVVPPGSKAEAEAQRRGWRVVTAAMAGDLDLLAVFRLRRILRAESPDLVHLHTGRATWLGGLAARSERLPAVTTRRMDRPVKRGLRTRLIYGNLVRHAVAISPAVERCLQAADVRCPVSLIASSVDPERLQTTRSRADVRAELGVAENARVLLVLAALVPRKGIDVLLDALGHVEGAVTLLIAGEGPSRDELENQARELGTDVDVRFLGRREDAPELLAACDLFCLPSRKEGLGVAALEAMAAGRAVLATRVGGLGEAIVHGESGWLIEPDDAPALGAAIEQLLGEDELRSRLAEGGKARVDDAFRAEQMVAKYDDLYRRLIR